MANSTSKPMTVRTTDERKVDFKHTYEVSGATSHHEFLGMLLQRFLAPNEINGIATNPEVIESAPNLTPEETEELLKSTFEASEVVTMEEFLDNLIQKFNKPEKVIETVEEIEPIQTQLKPNEILLNLTPAQFYAIRETVLSKNFASDQNAAIDVKIKGDFYSGSILLRPEFKPLFIRNIVLIDEMSADEKENAIRHNMAAFVINLYFMRLLNEGYDPIAVTPKALKYFVQEHPESLEPGFSLNEQSEPNEFVLSLSAAQYYAIHENVLTKGFAETQNEIFDSLTPENKPFLYFGNLFEPEIQSLWIRNVILTDKMPEEEKEDAIRHNMSAFLINMSLMHLIEGKIRDTSVTAKTLITFIQEQDQDSLLKEVV